MTDRIKGLTVTLDDDIREDDIEPVLNAIRQIRHVLDVRPCVVDHNDHMNRERIRLEMRKALFEALDHTCTRHYHWRCSQAEGSE